MNHYLLDKIYITICIHWGRDSSVGIVTRYGLDGLGIESWWGQDFLHTSRLALVPTQPPIKWVPDLSWGREVKWPGRGVDHPSPSSAKVEGSVELYVCSPSGPSWPVLGRTLPFYFTLPLFAYIRSRCGPCIQHFTVCKETVSFHYGHVAHKGPIILYSGTVVLSVPYDQDFWRNE